MVNTAYERECNFTGQAIPTDDPHLNNNIPNSLHHQTVTCQGRYSVGTGEKVLLGQEDTLARSFSLSTPPAVVTGDVYWNKKR